VVTFDGVAKIAGALEGVEEGAGSNGWRKWSVGDATLAWERPLRKNELEALGEEAERGPVLGIHVGELGLKEALLSMHPDVLFTTPHFNGYPAVLVRLERIAAPLLRAVLKEAWTERRSVRAKKKRAPVKSSKSSPAAPSKAKKTAAPRAKTRD
jgi:hypothetical protein